MPGAWLAALISLAIFLGGQLPRDRPLIPRLHFDLPSLPSLGSSKPGAQAAVREPRTYKLAGPRTAQKGGVLTVSGGVPGGLIGGAAVDVHWNAGPWKRIGKVRLVADQYRAEIPLSRAGMLNIRVSLPNGDRVRGSVRVTR
jgi:hypothetical protein